MNEVIVIAYKFNLAGVKNEIHTEVRVFGYDWWFEKDGLKQLRSLHKEKDPKWGYTLDSCIRILFIDS